jgi:hypothetical protein
MEFVVQFPTLSFYPIYGPWLYVKPTSWSGYKLLPLVTNMISPRVVLIKCFLTYQTILLAIFNYYLELKNEVYTMKVLFFIINNLFMFKIML